MNPSAYYFDRCIGKRFPEALLCLKTPFTVEYHHSPKNHFPQTMPDDEWLEMCGKNNWLAFSHDQKFHINKLEYTAIKQHKVGVIYLPGANANCWNKMLFLSLGYKKFTALVTESEPPFIYQILPNGKVTSVPLPT